MSPHSFVYGEYFPHGLVAKPSSNGTAESKFAGISKASYVGFLA